MSVPRVAFHDSRSRAVSRGDVWRSSLDECLRELDWVKPARGVARLETQLAEFCGAKHVVATSSGSAALALSLKALGVRDGDEVLTVALTFPATVSAIVLSGGTPVFVDVDPVTCTMDREGAARAVTSKSRAILPVSIYGQEPDIAGLSSLGLPLCLDACQAVRPGGFSSMSRYAAESLAAVSFGREKQVAGVGDGGALLTDCASLAQTARLYAYQGRRDEDFIVPGTNLRMHPLEAAVLLAELNSAPENYDRRLDLARRYDAAFAPLGIVSSDRDLSRHALSSYVIEVDNRRRFVKRLTQYGIDYRIHYPRGVHQYSGFAKWHRDLPLTERACERVVSLPFRASMTDPEAELVVAAVTQASSE